MTERPRGLRRLLSEGRDPDPRFTLANERTFLAWIRTSLALLAGGVGLETFGSELPELLRRVLSVLLVVLGGLLAVSAFVRWLAAERAMRTGRPLPLPGLAVLLSVGIGMTAAALLVAIVTAG